VEDARSVMPLLPFMISSEWIQRIGSGEAVSRFGLAVDLEFARRSLRASREVHGAEE
jgi:hypothetical protein